MEILERTNDGRAWTLTRTDLEHALPGPGRSVGRSMGDLLAEVEDLRAQWYGWTDEAFPRLQRVLGLSRR